MSRVDPGQAIEHDPLVERVHERDQRLERQVELIADRLERIREHGAPLGMHPREPLSSGRFQASARSSNQIFWYGRSSSR